MVNTEDLKSSGHCDLVGSSPIPGTTRPAYIIIDDLSNAEFTPEQVQKIIRWYKEFKLLAELKK